MWVQHASVSAPDHALPETPSGKGAADENFPVASILISPKLRPHVMRYYDFARAIDDIADNPSLAPQEKIDRLNGFEAAVTGSGPDAPGYAKALSLRDSLRETGVSAKHATDLVAAFRQDAVKLRYDAWEDLVGYCEFSANPVGRYLLELHGEDPVSIPASDALCTALQVLNHLQDCGDDHRNLNRVYLPLDWMREAGASVDDLAKPSLTRPLRWVIDQALDRCEVLVERARDLAPALQSKRLAAESATIVTLAGYLVARLRRGDPLATRVALSKADFAMAAARGVAGTVFSSVLPKRQPVR